jgi:FAD/FMN-containing dehydrogenase
MIGNNSCGIHSVMAGKTADNIDELEILTYDESSFEASPGHHIPSTVGKVAAKVAATLRDRADADHPE